MPMFDDEPVSDLDEAEIEVGVSLEAAIRGNVRFGFSILEERRSFKEPVGYWLCETVKFPLIVVSAKAHTIMWLMTMTYPVEVKWWLSCRHDHDKLNGLPIIVVEDVIVPYQTVSDGHAATTPENDQQTILELADTGVLETLWGSGHSHHHMAAITSMQDRDEILREFSRKVRIPGQELFPEDRYIVRVITNKRQDWEWTIVDVESAVAIVLVQEDILVEDIAPEIIDFPSLWEELQQKLTRSTRTKTRTIRFRIPSAIPEDELT